MHRWRAERAVWLRQHAIDPLAANWRELLRALPVAARRDYHVRFTSPWMECLDQCHGACLLRQPELSGIVAESLLHGDGKDYEVSDSLITAFREAGHRQSDIDRWFDRRKPKPHLDLQRANADQLIHGGVSLHQIFDCGLSTVSHPDIFDSYRVEGERTGRMAGIIVVPDVPLVPGTTKT